ncbi:MAG TPA: serine hydrolase [Polyangia bacterium]|jgi:D-alanyl-D-alanine endopeptidase (penicillin-binding protein 7)
MPRLLSLVLMLTLFAPVAQARKGRSRSIPVYTRSGEPNVQAQSAAVVDLSTGEMLYAKHADEVRPIASISKLMAALVVTSRKLDLDGTTQITESDKQLALRGARSRLLVGMTFTNRDLIHAMLIASDNRAVPALGRAVGLNTQELVAAMNAKAVELGLTHTHFGDPTGLDPRNTSTAHDLVGLLRAAMKVPLILEITEKAHYVVHPVGHPSWSIEYNNTDLIARGTRYDVLTGKTGYTDLALYCLAIAVKMVVGPADRPVAMVFLGAVGKMTRFGDFSRVAQWLIERKLGKRAGL